MVPFRHPLIVPRLPTLRRPRFTPSEAVILNALVNEAPHPVPVGRLRQTAFPFMSAGSLTNVIGSLRAKLGEERFRPVLIVSIRDGLRVVAYQWRGEI